MVGYIYYLLTYLPTPWSRVLLEKLTSKLCRLLIGRWNLFIAYCSKQNVMSVKMDLFILILSVECLWYFDNCHHIVLLLFITVQDQSKHIYYISNY